MSSFSGRGEAPGEREAGLIQAEQVRLVRAPLALPGGGLGAAFRAEDARSGGAVNAWRFAELLASSAEVQDLLSAAVCDGLGPSWKPPSSGLGPNSTPPSSGLGSSTPGSSSKPPSSGLGSDSGAVFFEARAQDRASAQGPGAFEFVLLPAPALDLAAQRASDFDEHLSSARAAGQRAATFRNAGGDALLVAPVPDARVPSAAYVHLSRFCRGARSFPELSRAVWSSVGAALLAQWSAQPRSKVWLSTSGLGVSHLHVRLDSRPKYYLWAAFK